MSDTLFSYLQQTQRFLREARQDMLNPDDLVSYINRARREIAMRCQCIRRLTPICGPIVSATVTAAGSGYSNAPTCTISAPDFPSGTGSNPNGAQATANAIVQSGTIAAIDIQYGGDGYFQPLMTITDATGSGATAAMEVAFVNSLQPGKEVYPFSEVDLSMFPGVASVYTILGLSILYSNYRFSLPVYSFSVYQAQIRQYSQYSYVPTFASQYGQGTSGSFYCFPLPSQVYQFELDCFCLPQDLVDDQSVEALPAPWTDGVPYFAAHLAYSELQNANFSRYYLELFDKMVQRYSNYARPGRVTNPYGRYIFLFSLGALELLQQVGSSWI